MKRLFGSLSLLVVLAAGAWLYSRQISELGPAESAPRASVDVTGVQNDLIAIANAERRRLASDGKYVSLDELISSGDISLPAARRGPYEYSSEVTDSGFRITAVHTGEAPAGVPQRVTIDETMSITRE